MIGKVIKITGSTVKVMYEYVQNFEKYHKKLKRNKNMLIHNENFEIKVGDVVEYQLCAPVSKMKKHKIVKVLGEKQ